jgi:hypothetical protein
MIVTRWDIIYINADYLDYLYDFWRGGFGSAYGFRWEVTK